MPRSGAPHLDYAVSDHPCFNEAGAIMPRSGEGERPFSYGVEPASMRPGQSCPGVAYAPVRPEAVAAVASMRPGQSCPGVAGAFPGVVPDREIGFNEAGAIMPRSGYSAVAEPPARPGLQ